MGMTGLMESLADQPSQKRAIGIPGAPTQAKGRRRYSSDFAQLWPAARALLWYPLYKKKTTNARIDPGRTDGGLESSNQWRVGEALTWKEG
jgi:hypothetical protein